MSGIAQETEQKPTSNPDSAERRNSLFAYLGHCIRLSHEKMSSKGNSDSAKQSWGRLMVSAISVYGALIKVAELYASQTGLPFYILTSNPQILRGNVKNWKIVRVGHASRGQGETTINDELRSNLGRKRITVTLKYAPARK